MACPSVRPRKPRRSVAAGQIHNPIIIIDPSKVGMSWPTEYATVNKAGDGACVAVRRVPPHFSIPPENAEVLPGGAVNLTCVAIGSPMPFVRWRLGAVELTPEDNPPIGKNILQLTDVRETATYTCVATSELGNIEFDAEVRVKGTAVLGTTSSLPFVIYILSV